MNTYDPADDIVYVHLAQRWNYTDVRAPSSRGSRSGTRPTVGRGLRSHPRGADHAA